LATQKRPKFDADRYRVKPVAGRVAVLASGGLDSSVLVGEMARAGCHVFPIYVRSGLFWEASELRMLRRYLTAIANKGRLAPLTVLRMPMDDVADGHWSVTGRKVPGYRASVASNYIAGRNLALLAKGAILCARNRIGEIALGALAANPFPDAQPKFFRAFVRTVEIGLGLKLRLLTPFAGLRKEHVIRRGKDLPLELTLSCSRPRGAMHCGSCTKCAERIAAFRAAGVPDPTTYARGSGSGFPKTRVALPARS
jgi:7-cyano-7-deazaguanine synthase